MKFYIAHNALTDATLGCFLTMREAKAAVKQSLEWNPNAWSTNPYVEVVDVPVTAESIRRLLGDHGGYATESKNVIVK